MTEDSGEVIVSAEKDRLVDRRVTAGRSSERDRRIFSQKSLPENDNISTGHALEELKQSKQNYGFRKWLFWITAATTAIFAVTATVLVVCAFIDPERLNANLRYIVIAYMSTMIIEIIGVMHILAGSLFGGDKKKKRGKVFR